MYIVEEREHQLSMNGKPIFYYDFHIFIDKIDAKNKAKEIRSNFTYRSQLNKARAYEIKRGLLINPEIIKRKCNGKEYYNLMSEINRKNSMTGKNLRIDKQFDLITGKAIDDALKYV